jgi:hypothetical protein
MRDVLLCAAQHNPELATRQRATDFLSHNGFNREDNYGVLIGEKKRERAEKKNLPISAITVSRHWDSSP